MQALAGAGSAMKSTNEKRYLIRFLKLLSAIVCSQERKFFNQSGGLFLKVEKK